MDLQVLNKRRSFLILLIISLLFGGLLLRLWWIQVAATNSFSPHKIDLVKHEFFSNDEKIYLTPKEFALMTELMRDPEKVKSRDELLDVVWGYDFVGQTNTVDVYIRTIRNKIGDPNKKLIQTVRGLGYCLRKAE